MYGRLARASLNCSPPWTVMWSRQPTDPVPRIEALPDVQQRQRLLHVVQDALVDAWPGVADCRVVDEPSPAQHLLSDRKSDARLAFEHKQGQVAGIDLCGSGPVTGAP